MNTYESHKNKNAPGIKGGEEKDEVEQLVESEADENAGEELTVCTLEHK